MVVPAPGGTPRDRAPTPRRSRADDDDRIPWPAGSVPSRRHAEGSCPPPRRRVVGVATRTGRPGSPGTCGATPESSPGPRPPIPQGPGLDPAHLARTGPCRDQRGEGGRDHADPGELAGGAQVEGAAVDGQEQPQEQAEAGQADDAGAAAGAGEVGAAAAAEEAVEDRGRVVLLGQVEPGLAR